MKMETIVIFDASARSIRREYRAPVRASGVVTDAGGLGLSDHVCWPYDDAPEYAAAALRWLEDGLALGQRLLYVSGRSGEQMREDVDPIPRVEHLLSDGTLTLLSLATVYDLSAPIVPEQQLVTYDALTRDALSAGHSGLRVLAEVTGLVADPARRGDHIRWEHLADDYMSRGNPLAAFCAYQRPVVGDPAIAALTAVHPVVREFDAVSPFRLFFDRGRLVLTGSVDTFSSARFMELLVASHVMEAPDDAMARGPVPITELDVSGVDFVDARGATTLAEGVRTLRARGVDVSVGGASSVLRRIWSVLQLDDVAGVQLGAGPA
jgi:anti-anti-sigma regulatory factor